MKKILSSIIILFVAGILSAQNIDTARFTNWINENSIELKEAGFSKLVKVLNDKTVIGLGECVHASKTINNVRFDVAKALIENGDFNIVAFEMSFNTGLRINHFLQTGEGDIEQILKESHFFLYSVEMLDFIKWMKQYNENTDNPVNLYGFDIQSNIDLVEDMLKFYVQTDKESENLTASLIEIFKNNNIWSFGKYPDSLQDSVLKIISRLSEKHTLNRKEYVLKAGFVEYEYAEKRLDVLSNALQMINSDYARYTLMRDSCNVELIRWMKDFEGEKSKVILFAHNGHLGKSLYWQPRVRTLSTEGFYEYTPQEHITGYYLSKIYGDKYYFIATQFGSGFFMGFDSENDYHLSKLEVTPPEQNSFPYLLHQTKKSPYYIGLMDALMSESTPRQVINYFCSLQSFYGIGAAYESKYWKARLIEFFDAIIYVDEVEESKILENAE